MKSVNTKETSIKATESVIFEKNAFLKYKQNKQRVNLETVIKTTYQGYQKKAANKLKPLKAIENEAKTQNLADAIGAVYNFDKDMKKNFEKMSKSVPDSIKTALSKVRNFSKTADIIKESSVIPDKNANLLKQLEKCLKVLDDCEKTYRNANSELMDYLISKKQHPSTEIFKFDDGKGEKYDLLAINPADITSMTSLITTIGTLRKLLESGNLIDGDQYSKVKYTDSKGKEKEVPYTSYVARLRYILNNILGGVGEGLGAISTVNTIDKFLKNLPQQLDSKDTSSVKVEGTGTGMVKDQGKTRTKKADYELVITYGSDGKSECKFGVSAKGQYWLPKNKRTKTGTITTTFQTSALKVFIQKAVSKRLLSPMNKNIFYNNLHYNLQGSSQEKEQYWLNRKIASAHFYDAVTGNDFKENVLFISFLDKTITIEDLFKDILKSKRYPTINLSEIKETRTRAIDTASAQEDQGIEEIEIDNHTYSVYKKSKEIINSYNEIKAQITYEH